MFHPRTVSYRTVRLMVARNRLGEGRLEQGCQPCSRGSGGEVSGKMWGLLGLELRSGEGGEKLTNNRRLSS